MPRCPKCGAEINSLDVKALTIMRFFMHLGEPCYEPTEAQPEDTRFYCPECGAVLFTSEEEAVKFLKQ